MSNPKSRIVTVSLILFVSFVGNLFRVAASQDIPGGASLIFVTHPKNPVVHPKATRAKGQQPSQPNPTATPANNSNNPAANGDMSDEVEDALALGNSARDAAPPRYQDAERAYTLALKLDAKDPRPYLGLGNLWYDQKHYEAAAKMYREATERMTPKKSPIMGAFSSKSGGGGISTRSSLLESAEAHAYLGNSLLQAGMFAEAEGELRTATFEDSRNAQLYALVGFSLFQQKKYSEASQAYKRALELSPETQAYKQLLDESIAHEQHPENNQ